MEVHQTGKGRLESLQAVRALAYMGILTFHCGLSQLGAWGVSVFFILSGFVLTYSYYDKPLKADVKSGVSFALRKIGKLYPLHIVTTWLVLVLLVQQHQTVQYAPAFLANCLLLHSWMPHNEIYLGLNGVSWYLSTAMFLYAAFPLVLRCVKKISSVRKAVCVCAAAFLIQCVLCMGLMWYHNRDYPFVLNYHWITYIFPVFRMGDFVIGACLGYIFMNGRLSISRGWATVLELLVVLCTFVCGYFYRHQELVPGYEFFRYTVIYTIPSAGLVLLFALKKGAFSNLLTCRPVVLIGDLSAYGFLIHQLVIRLLQYYVPMFFGIRLTRLAVFVIAFLATLLFSVLWKKLSTANARLAAEAAV